MFAPQCPALLWKQLNKYITMKAPSRRTFLLSTTSGSTGLLTHLRMKCNTVLDYKYTLSQNEWPTLGLHLLWCFWQLWKQLIIIYYCIPGCLLCQYARAKRTSNICSSLLPWTLICHSVAVSMTKQFCVTIGIFN